MNDRNYLGLYSFLCMAFGLPFTIILIIKLTGIADISWLVILALLFAPTVIIGIVILSAYLKEKLRIKYITRTIYNE